MFTFDNIFHLFNKSRSPRKMSRYAALPRGYNPMVVVKPPKPLHWFIVKGYTIKAFSRKDAIKRLKHRNLI